MSDRVADVRIELHAGARGDLRPLFELADDSPAEVVRAAVVAAAAGSATEMVVATAAADLGNLRFYQRQGFRVRSVERAA